MNSNNCVLKICIIVNILNTALDSQKPFTMQWFPVKEQILIAQDCRRLVTDMAYLLSKLVLQVQAQLDWKILPNSW